MHVTLIVLTVLMPVYFADIYLKFLIKKGAILMRLF